MKDAGSELVTVCNVKTNFRVVWQVWFAISVGFQGLFQFFRKAGKDPAIPEAEAYVQGCVPVS